MQKKLLTIGTILFMMMLVLSSSLSFAQDEDTTTPEHVQPVQTTSDGGATAAVTTTTVITATATATPIPSPTPRPTPVPPVGPWQGSYYNNANWQGNPVRTRSDYRINYTWANGTPFWPAINTDNFSIRWTNQVAFAPGFYQFNLNTDNTARLRINGGDAVANWNGQQGSYVGKPVFLLAGTHDLQLDYAHATGYSRVSLNWYQMPPHSAPYGRTTVTNNAGLAVRYGAGIQNRELTHVEDGTELILTGHRNNSGDWICVITPDGIVGWVNGYYTLSDTSYDDFTIYRSGFNPVAEELPFGTVSVQNLQMRYGPGFNYFVGNRLNVNEIVWAIGRAASNDWILVEAGDTTIGWVRATGLRLDRDINELPVRWGVVPVTTTADGS